MAPTLSRDLATALIAALRDGTVPAEGLEHIAVGLDSHERTVLSELEFVAQRHGGYKAIRGEWGACTGSA